MSRDAFTLHVRKRVSDVMKQHLRGPVAIDLAAKNDLLEHVRSQIEFDLDHGRIGTDLQQHILAVMATVAGTDSVEPASIPEAASQTQDAVNAAGAVPAHPADEDLVTDEIVPVAQMWVYCYHQSLGKIFFLEFGDDSTDYLHSSETFNAILRSVRFLA